MVRSLLPLVLLLWSCGEQNAAEPRTTTPSSEEKVMDGIAAQVLKAKDLQQAGRRADAMRVVDDLLQRYPGQLDALGIKAELLKAEGKSGEALTVLEKAYALQPRDKETAYNLAYEFAEARNPRALSLTDTLARYDKTETVARAWYIKGFYYNNTGNDKEALRFYDSSLVADYHFLDAYLDKGRLQLKQKSYDAALKTFATGQKISPAAPEFYLWVAKTQEAMGNRAGAKTNYQRAYALDTSLTEAKEAAERLRR